MSKLEGLFDKRMNGIGLLSSFECIVPRTARFLKPASLTLLNVPRRMALLIPVGGFFAIDAKEATRVAKQIKPKILIPMRFKTERCGFPIAPVEDF